MIRIARSAVDKARSNYYKTLAKLYNQNSKKYWEVLEDIEPKANAKIKGIVDDMSGEKRPITKSPEQVNSFFASIGAKLTSKFATVENCQKQFIPLLNKTILDIDHVDRFDVIAKLDEMSVSKSSGMTNISSGFIITAIRFLIDEFTHMYNITLATGIYPKDWKVAIVTPIPKIAQPKVCGDLRPISILPLPGRLLEKIINFRITQHLENTKYLIDQQNGFRANRSTTKCVSILIDRLLKALDNGQYAVTVFLDFKKAFDTVDHGILLWKLERAGLGPNICRLLANYLADRSQSTKVDGNTSSSMTVTTGVPQGSILGPLLFIIFTNDLVRISDLPLYTIFADDTSVTLTGRDLALIRDLFNDFFLTAHSVV